MIVGYHPLLLTIQTTIGQTIQSSFLIPHKETFFEGLATAHAPAKRIVDSSMMADTVAGHHQKNNSKLLILNKTLHIRDDIPKLNLRKFIAVEMFANLTQYYITQPKKHINNYEAGSPRRFSVDVITEASSIALKLLRVETVFSFYHRAIMWQTLVELIIPGWKEQLHCR